MADPRDSSQEADRPATPPPADTGAATPAEEELAPAEPTVGTGTSIALGCIAGTIVLIVIGLLFLLAVMILS